MASRPAIVLGSGRSALALARGLGRAHIPAICLGHYRDVAFDSRYFKQCVAVPPRSLDAEAGLLNALEQIAERERAVVFPSNDPTLEWVVDNWEAVRELADVPLPDDMDLVRRLTRKDRVGEEAERAEIPYPRAVRPQSAAELRACGLTPPFLVKPVQGKAFVYTFGAKVFTAETIDDAVDGWDRAHARGIETIVQELVPGHEGNIHSFFGYLDREHRPLAAVVGRKVRESPRPFGSSTVFAAKWNERVYELAVRLLQTAGYRGFAHVELAYDKRIDDFVLIEINTRVPAWAGIAMTRAFNIARVAYLDLCGYEQERTQLRQPWLWVDLIDDVSAGAPAFREVPRFVAPYLRPRSVGALFAWDDPSPGCREGVRLLRSTIGFRTRLRRLGRRLPGNPSGGT